jgi:membrane protease YdiL (CAAX protease family)
MTSTEAFHKRHPVLAYYIVVFVISWGGMLLVGAPGIAAGTNWQTDPMFQLAISLMLAGPPIAGVLMTILVSGKKGVRELFSRLIRWRASARSFAAALLIAPLVQTAVLLLLSLFSPEFLPAILKTGDKTSLLIPGVIVGLIGGFIEELGWTGFVIPRLRLLHGVLTTGVIVGILWGVWHLLQMLWVGSTSSQEIPLSLFLPQYFFSAIASLTAFRVLMVRIYDQTESLLVAVLMHGSYIFSTLFVFAPPITGRSFLTYSWVFTAVLWAIVAVVTLFNRGQLESGVVNR